MAPPACVAPLACATLEAFPPLIPETCVAKPNYHQARRQKELARKQRQQEKQQRRIARVETTAAASTDDAAEAATEIARSDPDASSLP